MGARSGRSVDVPVTWVDCDGNSTSWNGISTCTDADGNEYNIVYGGGGIEHVAAIDECLYEHNGRGRTIVTAKGTGKVYFLKYHVWFTVNTCTGGSTVKFDDWRVECD